MSTPPTSYTATVDLSQADMADGTHLDDPSKVARGEMINAEIEASAFHWAPTP